MCGNSNIIEIKAGQDHDAFKTLKKKEKSFLYGKLQTMIVPLQY